ncbi:MAG: hypothetical protein FWE68_05265, partial [Defluviitaleaceae bacterium]|nr:hypothetical protein [Defluviitaleaceae bacterium]
ESHYVLGRATDAQFKSDEAFYDEFVRFCKSANDYRINLRFPIGGYHDDMTEFLRAPNRPDKFFSLDPMGNSTRPKGKSLQGYKLGYYGEFGDLPQKMEAYAAENGLVCKGPVFVVYLLDEVSIIDPGKYLSRVAVQVY